MLQNNDTDFIFPAIRLLGHIVTGNEDQTNAVLQCGFLHRICTLMLHPSKVIRKETCWTISNITAGSCDQIQAVIDSNIIPSVIYRIQVDEFEVKKEAAWILTNALNNSHATQISQILEHTNATILCEILKIPNEKVVLAGLEAAENAMKACYAYIEAFETAGILSIFERLTQDDNSVVSEAAESLKHRFFDLSEDEQDEFDVAADSIFEF